MAEQVKIYPIKNTIKLLRIPFSFYLMPVFLLAASQAGKIDYKKTLLSFCIIHLLIYPASNGYNSYIDKDKGSIGGLENPPQPGVELFYTTFVMDLFGIILSAIFIGSYFALAIFVYILASRAYSSPQIRLKKYPILGFLTVIFFQGAFTFFFSTLGITGSVPVFENQFYFLLLASSLQIAGAYPLTQIYQFKEDLENGVKTISYQLGYNGTFLFSGMMFALCDLCYFIYFQNIHQLKNFIILQIFFIPTLIYFNRWFLKVRKNNSEANFRNTMLMNKIASISMSTCFLIFLIIKYFS